MYVNLVLKETVKRLFFFIAMYFTNSLRISCCRVFVAVILAPLLFLQLRQAASVEPPAHITHQLRPYYSEEQLENFPTRVTENQLESVLQELHMNIGNTERNSVADTLLTNFDSYNYIKSVIEYIVGGLSPFEATYNILRMHVSFFGNIPNNPVGPILPNGKDIDYSHPSLAHLNHVNPLKMSEIDAAKYRLIEKLLFVHFIDSNEMPNSCSYIFKTIPDQFSDFSAKDIGTLQWLVIQNIRRQNKVDLNCAKINAVVINKNIQDEDDGVQIQVVEDGQIVEEEGPQPINTGNNNYEQERNHDQRTQKLTRNFQNYPTVYDSVTTTSSSTATTTVTPVHTMTFTTIVTPPSPKPSRVPQITKTVTATAPAKTIYMHVPAPTVSVSRTLISEYPVTQTVTHMQTRPYTKRPRTDFHFHTVTAPATTTTYGVYPYINALNSKYEEAVYVKEVTSTLTSQVSRMTTVTTTEYVTPTTVMRRRLRTRRPKLCDIMD